MAQGWIVLQWKDVVTRFRADHCSSDLWDQIVISLAILIERGPGLAGMRVAKKLRDGDGIWELIAKLGNQQPRLLFYVRPDGHSIVIVYGFIKKGNYEYGSAIKLAQQRRSSVERGNAITAPLATGIH